MTTAMGETEATTDAPDADGSPGFGPVAVLAAATLVVGALARRD
jgi:PGF-CTERM protein